MTDFDQKFLQEVRRVANSDTADARQINTHLLGMLIWHRSRLIEQCLTESAVDGTVTVSDGLLKGLKMRLPVHAGNALPMMLGTYESELHPHLAAALRRGYQHVVNIGCGDGYYLVGLARLLPAARCFGHDTNPAAQEGCRQTALLNGVAERVTVGGLFDGAGFAQHPPGVTLVICDIEGGEDALLNPAAFPALQKLDIIVELHEMNSAGVTERLQQRFSATHDIQLVTHQAKRAALPVTIQGLTELDEMLCVYEGRGGATPWLVMQAKVA